MTHQEIGLRTNDTENVNGYIPPGYITLMNVLNPPSPALRLRRELMRKLSLRGYTRGRIDGTKSNDVERRKRLTVREREMRREIVETEIALNRCDPGYAAKIPGGYFHRRDIFEIMELEHYLCDGLQQQEIRLMSNHAIQEEELRNRNLSRLPNAGYDPNQPRAEDGEWSTDGGGRLFAQADTNEKSQIVSQGVKPSTQSIPDPDQLKKKWDPKWDPLKDPDVSKQIEAVWKQTKDDSKYQEYGFVVYRDKDGNIVISDVMKKFAFILMIFLLGTNIIRAENYTNRFGTVSDGMDLIKIGEQSPAQNEAGTERKSLSFRDRFASISISFEYKKRKRGNGRLQIC